MDSFKLNYLLLALTLFVFGCQKDENIDFIEDSLDINEERLVSRGGRIYSDSAWIKPTTQTLKIVFEDMVSKSTLDEIGTFLSSHGQVQWDESNVLRDKDDIIISIPTVKEDTVFSIIFAHLYDDIIRYKTVDIDRLKKPTEDLIDDLGVTFTILSVFEFIRYEQQLGNYTHGFLLDHLYNPKIQDEALEVIPRGWCLVEIILYEPPTRPIAGVYEATTATGIDYYIDGGNFIRKDQAIIQGASVNEGVGTYTIYHFWAECPDEHDQDGWENGFTTNISNPNNGSSGNPDDGGDNWDYDNPRWTENTKECLFIFDDPWATGRINNLEEKLISTSCGDAAAYTIKSIIDYRLNRLCEEFYQDPENSPPSEVINTQDIIDELYTSISSNQNYLMGQKICKICEQSSNESACILEFDSCPKEEYDECVNSIFCKTEISNIEDQLGIELSAAVKDIILSSGLDCGGDSFMDELTNTFINRLIEEFPQLQLAEAEVNYIRSHTDLLLELYTFLTEEEVEDETFSASKIIIQMAMNDLLDKSIYELQEEEALLESIIYGNFQNYNLSSHINISAVTWATMFSKEWNDGDSGGVIGFFKKRLSAVKLSIKEGWEHLVQELASTIEAKMLELKDAGVPATAEEWQALIAVFGPAALQLGLDIGTDFIPVVGELKGFYKTADALTHSQYGNATLEFLGALAGILPISDIIKGGTKVADAAVSTIKAWKVVKAMSKVSASIYAKLIDWVQAGKKVIWDDGLKKLIFKNGDEVVGEIDEFGVPNIKSNSFISYIDVEYIKSLTAKGLVDGPNPNKIYREFIEENANRFNITDGPLADEVADIVANGDPTGTKTEYLMNEIFKDAGYTLHDGSYGAIDVFGRGMHGFDGVYVKGSLDNPTEIIINESKQFNANNADYVKLNQGTQTNPAQMTDAWVDKVIEELRMAGKNEVADGIEIAKQNMTITKIVTVVDATPASNAGALSGGVSIMRVE